MIKKHPCQFDNVGGGGNRTKKFSENRNPPHREGEKNKQTNKQMKSSPIGEVKKKNKQTNKTKNSSLSLDQFCFWNFTPEETKSGDKVYGNFHNWV